MVRTLARLLFVALVILPYVTYADGLLGRWRFDEASGATAFDASANHRDGTLVNGPSRVPGPRGGGALFFDGFDRAVVINGSATLVPAAAFTVSAWVNPDAFVDAWGGAGFIIANGRDCCGWSGGGIGLHLGVDQRPPGTIASGAPLDTASAGAKSLTATAIDEVGNTSSQTVPYNVTYQICLLFDNEKPVKSGSTLPIKLQLCNAAGGNMSSSSVVLTALRVTKLSDQTTGDPIDPGESNPDNNFRFTDGAYHYNLKTTGLATGTYALAFTVTGDPVEHTVTFQVR